MKIRILGTGYGECKIKKKSSRDFRRKGGVFIDDVKIDAFDKKISKAELEKGIVLRKGKKTFHRFVL